MKRVTAQTAVALWGILVVALLCGCDRSRKEGAMTEESKVTLHSGDDPEILAASQEARKTFRFFWKQVSYDYNRIVPALELACIKVAFSDDDSDTNAQVEHMWVSDIDCDGVSVKGTLINSPNRLKSVKEGDPVECRIDEIGDWMCVLDGKVYGAYTVQVTRKRMSPAEREAHDGAWGLEFSPPEEVLVPPETSEFEPTIASLLKEQLEKDVDTVISKDDVGRTPLHVEALFGRTHTVRVLLDFGADPKLRCDRGWTPRDYATALGWTNVMAMLEAAEAEQ